MTRSAADSLSQSPATGSVFGGLDRDLGVRREPATAALRYVPVRNRDAVLRRLLASGDSLAIAMSIAIALVSGDQSLSPRRVLWGILATPLLLVTFKLYGLYDRDVKRITHSTLDDLPWLFHATVIGALLLWVYSRYTPLGKLTLLEIVSFSASMLLLVIAARVIVRTVFARRVGRDRTLLIGTGPMARMLSAKITCHPEYRLELIGSLGSRQDDTLGLPVLGEIDELEPIARAHGVNRVMFSSGELADSKLEEILQQCRGLALKVSMLPRLPDMLGAGVEIDDVEGVTVLGINPPWLPRSSRALKRAMDLTVALPFLLLISPLVVLTAILIKLDSSGPVFFAQERVGKGGGRFRLFKFRSMVAQAEAQRAALLHDSTDPDWLKLEHDPRITRVGRWLRRLSIDEIPQLWNVVRGEMSLVGPRPLIPVEDERVRGWARGRLDLTPGLTGYWQVLGRTRIPFEEMVKLDYLYVMNWSLWEDVRLILRTVPVVIGGRGAN